MCPEVSFDSYTEFVFEICNYYYKTQFLLDCYMTEKHMYKYLCKILTAKAHYCVRHLKTGPRWPPGKRPAWLGRGVKKPYANKRSKPITINDVFSFEPISPEEQYSMIQACAYYN
ncbi:Uncharacterized protein OBRU01_08810 [Operophtera brumata]|uniref:Uncharacterized protein n=1 Tax=Operophtera brumata TaxID=104452 RepID=A0A0L7LGK7_OPEBR|nr:Uncharacterized protein OBRU01_08810 [Operophtera brumata]